MSDKNLDSELESFRRQWLSDLRSKTDHPSDSASATVPIRAPAAGPSSGKDTVRTAAPRHHADDDHDQAYLHGPSFDDLPTYHTPGHDAASHPHAAEHAGKGKEKKLVSALDHFEEAMAREAQGNMGASLTLYRKAYKLDNGVDRRYREKHFPKGHTKPTTTAPSAPASTPTTTATTTDPQNPPEDQPAAPLSITDLIASFSHLAIQPAPPEVEGSTPPPCPISLLPDELLVHILTDALSAHDIADLPRISLVCRRFAYLAATEQRIWRSICLKSSFSFPRMHHSFPVSIEGDSLLEPYINDDGTVLSPAEQEEQIYEDKVSLTRSLHPHPYPSWKAMFRHRPRIRFNGIYISTVNYQRIGQASTNQSTWGGPPILIVTYYRYLRLYPDGTALSLLTTSEPADVVHHVSFPNLHHHRANPSSTALPSSVMRHALRGRWRLSSSADYPDLDARDQESDLFIETEGVGSKYTYRMDLSLRSAGKGAKNNKFVWRSFHSYNKLTDDLAEFGLKNDKPFFFSRVRSYGLA